MASAAENFDLDLLIPAGVWAIIIIVACIYAIVALSALFWRQR